MDRNEQSHDHSEDGGRHHEAPKVSDADAKAKVVELLKSASIAMFITRHPSGTMHARPMGTRHAEFEGELWFLTDINSEKVKDIRAIPEVAIAYSEEGKNRYVSVSGIADIVTDRKKVKEMWFEPARVWFPKGSDDPDLSLIRVRVTKAEYWDSPGARVTLVFSYLKSLITGKEAGETGENAEVSFR